MKIRKADAADISALAVLMEELGYPTSVENMKKRFAYIDAHSDYCTLVASYKGKIVGMAGLVKSFYYEKDGCYVRITALIVDSDYHNIGIGTKLVEASEKWARSKGASVLALNSGNRTERLKAHSFYRRTGFAETSIGFVKELA